VLTGDRGVATRWRTRGSERRRLELIARAKEGTKELGREGMRCGEIRGSHRPFIGVGGAPERGGPGGSNGDVNAFNAIEDGGEVNLGMKGGGNDGRVSNGSGSIRGWIWMARGGRR
jgi:hypothetical protein